MKIASFKRAILVLFLTSALFTTTHAQVQFGIKGGLTIAEMLTGKNETAPVRGSSQTRTNYPRTNINAGIFFSIPLTKILSLQPELLYNNQGSTSKSANTALTSADETYKFNYVNLPILLKYHTSYGAFLETGPQLGYLLRARIDEVTLSQSHTARYSVTDQYKRADLGWALGVGYTSPFNLGIDIRYVLGLTNINNTDGSQTAPIQNGKIRNSGVQIGIFYIFGKSGVSHSQ